MRCIAINGQRQSCPARYMLADDDDDINLNLQFVKTEEWGVYKLKDVKTGKFIEALFGMLRLSPEKKDTAPCWKFCLQSDGYCKIRNIKDGKCLFVSEKGIAEGIVGIC